MRFSTKSSDISVFLSNIVGSRLTTILKNLERCDFIISYSQFGNKVKGTIYRLVDFYTLFYLKFFELICFTHLPQIRQKLGISGISTSASSWRYVPGKTVLEHERGAQTQGRQSVFPFLFEHRPAWAGRFTKISSSAIYVNSYDRPAQAGRKTQTIGRKHGND